MKTIYKIHALESAALLMILCLSPFYPARGDEGSDPPPIPRTKPISYYTGLVSTMLPSFDGTLLSVPNGPNWMAGKTVHQVAVSVQDSDPGTIVAHGSIVMGYDPPNGPRYIKLDFSEGYIRYTNRNRSFHAGSPCTAVSASEAESGLVATLGALGLPTSEWSSREVSTVMERGVDGEGQDPPTEQVCEIEQMVSLTRKISNGYPVFSSGVRESISNLHERARLLIDWPQFALETGLIMRTRTSVVTELAQRIWEAESGADGLGAEVEMEILLGYERGVAGFVPVARAAFADIYNRYAGQIITVPLANNPASEAESQGMLALVQFRARVDALGGDALLDFYLPESGQVRLDILDVSGRKVVTLADAPYTAGWHQAEWKMRDRDHQRVAAGVYFARLSVGGQTPTRKILVIH
jgi:hypothetical protein